MNARGAIGIWRRIAPDRISALVLLLAAAARADELPTPLGGAKGDPQRGRAIVANRQVGL